MAALALDSNFNFRTDVAPFSTEKPCRVKENFKAFYDALGPNAGLIILTYGLDNCNIYAKLCIGLDIKFKLIDILSVAQAINDSDGMHCMKISHPKLNLTYLSATHQDAGDWKECMQIASFYKEATKKGLL